LAYSFEELKVEELAEACFRLVATALFDCWLSSFIDCFDEHFLKTVDYCYNFLDFD
jgi:hypothetical protein